MPPTITTPGGATVGTSPVPAIDLGLLNAVVFYLRRDELVALLHRVKG